MKNVDQRGFDNQPGRDPPRQPTPISDAGEELLDARQAARLLDVKLPTLYAYASRGLLKSLAPHGPGAARSHHYLRGDVERLKARHDARKGHAAVAASALRWGEPVMESASRPSMSGARSTGDTLPPIWPTAPWRRSRSCSGAMRCPTLGRSGSRPTSPGARWPASCPATRRLPDCSPPSSPGRLSAIRSVTPRPRRRSG